MLRVSASLCGIRSTGQQTHSAFILRMSFRLTDRQAWHPLPIDLKFYPNRISFRLIWILATGYRLQATDECRWDNNRRCPSICRSDCYLWCHLNQKFNQSDCILKHELHAEINFTCKWVYNVQLHTMLQCNYAWGGGVHTWWKHWSFVVKSSDKCYLTNFWNVKYLCTKISFLRIFKVQI